MSEPIQKDRRYDFNTRDRLEQLAISTERLVVSTTSLEKVVDSHQRWIDNHDEHYHDLKLDVKQTQMTIHTWSEKIEWVEVSINKLTDQLTSLVQEGLKIKGGWMVLTMLGSAIVGVIAILKSFGLI